MEFYRYEIKDRGDGEIVDPRIILIKCYLVKETPKGYWIRRNDSLKRKWIPKESKKRYAYPDKVSALENLKRRTEHYIWHLNIRLSIAKGGLNRAVELQEKTQSVQTI